LAPLLLAALFVASAAAEARAVPVAGLTYNNRLVFFDSNRPERVLAVVSVLGLPAGEGIAAIDFRPRTGQIYALGGLGNLYVIDPATGLATRVGTQPLALPAAGGVIDIDFDPVNDRLRVTNAAGLNLRLDPDTGALVATDPPLVYAPGEEQAGVTPTVVAIAYSNNSARASSTTLYGIDWRAASLVRIGSEGGSPVSPNSGRTFLARRLQQTRFNFDRAIGFDIAPNSNTGFLVVTRDSLLTAEVPNFQSVNLETGVVTPLDTPGRGGLLYDIAVVERAVDLFALLAANRLVRLHAHTPGVVSNLPPLPFNAISSAPANPVLIDYDHQRGWLYGFTADGRIIVSEPETGVRPCCGGQLFQSLGGAGFGFSLPPAGLPHLVTDAEQNFAVNTSSPPGISPRSPLAYAPGDPNFGADPGVAGAAFTQDLPRFTLFDIDANLDTLVHQGFADAPERAAESGQLFTVGPLGVDTTSAVGFDILDAPLILPRNPRVLRTGTAFASLTRPGEQLSGLYTLDLRTGAASLVGQVAADSAVVDIAAVPTVGTVGFEAMFAFAHED
ncbi:MAG TPA: DUF4394 domain-containing protein, partial [Pyrinomonadaceae bacterium]|nr:DUF4394 domain-containing protein [Pyrinomonadaceae bacterium]